MLSRLDMEPPGGWPAGLWRVPYLSSAIPGAAVPPSWLDGSNCQRFAYGVLDLFELHLPALRSSQLWAEQRACSTVARPQALDLVLYSPTGDAFAAHVGVWINEEAILHLCAEDGRPTLWAAEDFAARPHYAQLVGFKRVHA
ncbi:MAG: hydrolase [Acidimicrobiales bacterium]